MEDGMGTSSLRKNKGAPQSFRRIKQRTPISLEKKGETPCHWKDGEKDAHVLEEQRENSPSPWEDKWGNP